jgi:CBS domain containing-hemolysin-like protein
LGHIPDQGASVKYQEIEIEVTQVMGPKILCLELRKLNGSLETLEGSGLPEPA